MTHLLDECRKHRDQGHGHHAALKALARRFGMDKDRRARRRTRRTRRHPGGETTLLRRDAETPAVALSLPTSLRPHTGVQREALSATTRAERSRLLGPALATRAEQARFRKALLEAPPALECRILHLRLQCGRSHRIRRANWHGSSAWSSRPYRALHVVTRRWRVAAASILDAIHPP